jgi:cytochrome c-type biogenesis protein CcmF
VQERRSMLRVWNMTLVILTFFLTIFGTFMTRSGIVQSVHSFGDNPELAMLFSIFMVVILVFSFGWVIYRLPLLRASNELDSWASREAAFLVNNWILLFCAFFILFATMFPTLSEAVTGQRLTVAAPFFNVWMVPIGLILLLLTGVAPLLAWRKSTLTNLRDSFFWPTTAALVTAATLKFGFGIAMWSSGLCFTLCAFVAATITQEFVRGGAVRRRNTGTDLVTAIIGLVGRNRRRYGGYIVHLGIVLTFLGFGGNGSKKDELFRLAPGQEATVGDFTVKNERVAVTDDGQKQTVSAHIAVYRDGQQIDTMYPGRSVFRKQQDQEARTDVAIRRSIAEDLYLVLAPDVDFGTQTISLQVVVNPLVNWIWLGFGVLAFGTGIALLPERTYSFALGKLPLDVASSNATTALTILALVGASLVQPATLAAQEQGEDKAPVAAEEHVADPNAAITPSRNALEEELRHEIGCICGTCAHEALSKCTCGYAQQMRAELRGQIDQDKTRDEIIAHLIQLYGGQHFLMAPIDEGFNRLAWIVPYALAGTGFIVVGLVAIRWSRQRDASGDNPLAPVDPVIEERLDDELRNLD